MDSPAARTLDLLALLQGGRPWAGADLVARLEISPRTLRRDIQRLRNMGYLIESSPGPGGVYRLQPSIKVPPLVLDADEVSTLITGLLVLESWAPQDPAAVILRTKLEQLLPASLKRQAVATAVATQISDTGNDSVDWSLVATIAEAVASEQGLRFAYADQQGRDSVREVAPYRHVLRGGHWYLVAHDHQRGDWRVFRSDRIHDAVRTLTSAVAPAFPDDTIEEWLRKDFGRRRPLLHDS